jgi:hypothetical protein
LHCITANPSSKLESRRSNLYGQSATTDSWPLQLLSKSEGPSVTFHRRLRACHVTPLNMKTPKNFSSALTLVGENFDWIEIVKKRTMNNQPFVFKGVNKKNPT